MCSTAATAAIWDYQSPTATAARIERRQRRSECKGDWRNEKRPADANSTRKEIEVCRGRGHGRLKNSKFTRFIFQFSGREMPVRTPQEEEEEESQRRWPRRWRNADSISRTRRLREMKATIRRTVIAPIGTSDKKDKTLSREFPMQ